ncbi:MAG: PAS domain S-box protein [Candidatus Hodarchaeota archaeon]
MSEDNFNLKRTKDSLNRQLEQKIKERTKELRESEQKFKNIFTDSPVGMEIYDSNGKLIDINQACLDLFGVLDVNEVLGIDLFNDPNIPKKSFKKLKKGDIIRFETLIDFNLVKDLYQTKKTGTIYIEVIITPLFHKELNSIINYLVQIQDITDRKIAEKKLEESERQYRATINSLGDPMHVISENYEIILMNDALKHWLKKIGLKTDIIGKTPIESWPFLTDKVMDEYRSVFKNGVPIVTVESSTVYNREIITETRKIPIFQQDNIIQVITIIRNITESKEAEQKLIESEARFRNIFESIPMGIFLYNLNSREELIFKGFNPAAEKILKIDCSQFIDKTIEDAFPPLIETDVPERYRSLAKEEGVWKWDQLDYADNQIKGAYEVVAFHSSPNKMVTSFNDITERIESELKLKESEEKFKTLFKHIPIPTYVWKKVDNSIILIDYNDAAYKKTEAGVKNLLGIKAAELYKENPNILEYLYRCADEKVLISKEMKYQLHTSKKESYLDATYTFIPPDLILVHLEDITERKQAENVIRNALADLDTIFNAAGDGMRVVDKNHNVLRVNHAFTVLTGVSETELLEQKCYEQFPHPKCHTPQCTIQCILAGEERIDTEVVKKRQDGSEVTCILVATPFRNADGVLLGVVETFKDISIRKKTELLLIEKEKFLSNVFSSIQDGICIINKDYTILRTNPTMENWYSHMSPIVGKKCYQVYQYRTEPCEDCLCAKIYETCEPILKVIPRKGHKGEELGILEVYVFPLLDQETGIVNGVIEYIRDVSEHYTAEQKLKESEAKYRNILETIREGYFEIDLNGNFTFFNDAFCEILKFPKEEFIGHNYTDFISIKNLEDVYKMFNSFFKTKIPQSSIEFKIKSTNGNIMFVESSAYLRYDSDGHKIGFYGLIRDITEKKKAEEMIKQEIEKLKELDRIKTEFVYRTSHELKTPLVSISSASQLLLDNSKEKIDNKTKTLLQIIYKGGERLELLIENLLDVSRIESRKLELKKEKNDIVKIILECIDELKYAAKARNLKITHELNGDFNIKIDSFRIRQVILNILWNAIKNTLPNGIISISLEIQKNFVDIKIKDTGVGFTQKEKTKIFEKFGKIERYGKGMDIDTEGSGLGLYISKEIVIAHKGTIWVESKGRNKGSTFIVRLPTKN